MMLLRENVHVWLGIINRGVPEFVWIHIGDLPMYTFLVQTHARSKVNQPKLCLAYTDSWVRAGVLSPPIDTGKGGRGERRLAYGPPM